MPAFDPRLVVVGFDPTPESLLALDRAAEIAERFGAAVVVVVSAPIPLADPLAPGRVGEPVGAPVEAAAYERAVHEELAAVRERLAGRALEPEIVTVAGGAGDLADVAEQRSADLIVLAARSQGLLERLIVGDPAGAVSRRASCDVLIVHHPGDPTAAQEGPP
jgi:nucleotide-binding universal stress UspA family protein